MIGLTTSGMVFSIVVGIGMERSLDVSGTDWTSNAGRGLNSDGLESSTCFVLKAAFPSGAAANCGVARSDWADSRTAGGDVVAISVGEGKVSGSMAASCGTGSLRTPSASWSNIGDDAVGSEADSFTTGGASGESSVTRSRT